MRLLLLQPPIEDFYDTDIRLQPIGLCYLKAVVRKYLPAIEVTVKDYHHGHGRYTIPVPAELAYLKLFYRWPDKSPFSTFYHYYHFGASFSNIAAEVAAAMPDIVAISSLFSPYYREVLRCAEEIKRVWPCAIVVGGSHVSAHASSILSHSAVDFVIRGEGERALVEFLREWYGEKHWENVSNLGYKRAGELRFNPLAETLPLADIPLPDFSDFTPDDYTLGQRPLSFIVASRSCPHRCAFCSVHLTFGHNYRRRQPEEVVAEIATRYRQGFRVFDFEDDDLTCMMPAMKRLCHLLIAAFPQRDVQFMAMNGVSYHSLDAELLQLMKQAGFSHLNLALVSSDEYSRAAVGRPHTLEKYVEVVREAFRLGFAIVSYQIIGLPHETLDSMVETLVFSAVQPVLLGASPFYLTPGSPIAAEFPEPTAADIVKARLTAMAIETTFCRREDIYTLLVTTRILNFLKAIPVCGEESSLADTLNIARQQGRRDALGVELLERLLTEDRLYAATGRDYKTLDKFAPALFRQVWQGLSYVTTLQGKHIKIFKDAQQKKQAK
jgi:radical SAM superfamily enzyme YgiQ (UPF0313 family)